MPCLIFVRPNDVDIIGLTNTNLITLTNMQFLVS